MPLSDSRHVTCIVKQQSLAQMTMQSTNAQFTYLYLLSYLHSRKGSELTVLLRADPNP